MALTLTKNEQFLKKPKSEFPTLGRSSMGEEVWQGSPLPFPPTSVPYPHSYSLDRQM